MNVKFTQHFLEAKTKKRKMQVLQEKWTLFVVIHTKIILWDLRGYLTIIMDNAFDHDVANLKAVFIMEFLISTISKIWDNIIKL